MMMKRIFLLLMAVAGLARGQGGISSSVPSQLEADYKKNVLVASTANIDLTEIVWNSTTIDGVTITAAGQRFLAKNQSTTSQNGIYISGGSGEAAIRASDANTWEKLPGSLVVVTSGTANASKLFVNSSAATGTPGSTAISYTEKGSASPGGSSTYVQLNNAGAFGGVSGLTASVTTGAMTQTQTSLGTTTLPGLTVANSTAAALGAQQVSGAVRWQGYGFSTGGGGSVAVPFQAYVLPVQGSSNPNGTWVLQQGIGGGYADVMTVSNGGELKIASVTGLNASTAYFLPNANSAATGLSLGNSNLIGWGSSSASATVSSNDTLIGRQSAANLRLGAADVAGAPVAQSLGVQAASGVSNTAGADWTLYGSSGTGTGAGGAIILKTAPASTSSSTKNTLVEAVRIKSTLALCLAGALEAPKTITAGGTTGNQTIDKMSGSVNFAAAATSLTVTCNLVTTSSIIIGTVGTNDTTMKSVAVVAGSGSFVIYPDAAPTGETRVNFLITN